METTAVVPKAGGEDFELLDRYSSAANYLTVAQIYLQENPLLREPLLPSPAGSRRIRRPAALSDAKPGNRRRVTEPPPSRTGDDAE